MWKLLTLLASVVAVGALGWALSLRRSSSSEDAEEPADGSALRRERARRRELESSLEVAHARVKRVLDSLSDAFIHVDPEWRFTFFNRAARELLDRLGRHSDDLLGTYLWDAFPTPPDASIRVALEEAMERRRSRTRITRFDELDGWIEVRAFPADDGGLSVHIRDVTDRKEAEEALRESEERFRALFEDDVAGNFVTDVEGNLQACNQAFARMFGFASVDEALGVNVYDLYPSRDERDAFLERIRRERTLEYLETEARRTDGSPLHLVENVRGIFDSEGRLKELRGHLIDITEQRRLEVQLQQAQKLEAVGRLAGGIAHDFNNLLTTITGHADLLLMEDDLPPAASGDVRQIRRAATRAASLTGQLLAFSRRQVLQPETLTLDGVIEDVSEMLVRLMSEKIDVRIETGEELPPVRADAGQLEQVLMNLAINARDAMPDGGELVLAAGEAVVAEDEVRRDEQKEEIPPGSYVYFEVRDEGSGIPDDVRKKIFEPFYTTKGPGDGTGLGLSMVYGIVKQSGGYVDVESQEGVGTTFRVLLPAASVEPDRLDDPGDHRDRTGTIVVHQDDRVVRKMVRRVLQREGHMVLEAESAEETAAFLREWSAPIHLVLTDTLSTGADGEALDTIADERRPELRFLLTLPAKHGREEVDHGHPILRVPFSSRDLRRRVSRLLSDVSHRPAPEQGRP